MYILKPDEEARIDAALERIDAGEWVEHAEVRKEMKEWLLQSERGVKSDGIPQPEFDGVPFSNSLSNAMEVLPTLASSTMN